MRHQAIESFAKAKNSFESQRTLKKSVSISGFGVHSGQSASIVIHPAKPNSGITFLRKASKAEGAANVDQLIPAHYNFVGDTQLCTVLGDPDGLYVATVEHLLAAFRGLGIDNARIEINGPEVPVMDGSAWAFVQSLQAVGLQPQAAAKRIIRVLRPVKVVSGKAQAELRPFDGCRFDIQIDFDNPVIGRQHLVRDLNCETFINEISRARTFGFLSDAKALRKAGFALGSSLENSVVIDQDKILNEDGLRYSDEFVRHKMLDAIGDLALAGAELLAEYVSVCGGHKLNLLVLKALFSSSENWCIEEVQPDVDTVSQAAAIRSLRHVERSVAAAEI